MVLKHTMVTVSNFAQYISLLHSTITIKNVIKFWYDMLKLST
jgi:hypothetical protein